MFTGNFLTEFLFSTFLNEGYKIFIETKLQPATAKP